jgi:hypothetical protein
MSNSIAITSDSTRLMSSDARNYIASLLEIFVLAVTRISQLSFFSPNRGIIFSFFGIKIVVQLFGAVTLLPLYQQQ